jgi:TRAP-type C4-dicarboxylate transport system permease large subunit
MEMSLITPPVGVNVFIISGVAKDVPMYTIFRGILPFWVAMFVCIILLIIFPQIALFLPVTMSH